MTSRRGFLRGGALTAAGLAAGIGTASGQGSAASRRGTPTFVFIPGSHGSGTYLAPLTAELTIRGHRAFTVDPPGHGAEAVIPSWYCAPQDAAAMASAPSPIAHITLADAVNRAVRAVVRAAANGPVILVAHSLGGATAGMVGNAVPALISRIVYVSAYCPVTLGTVAEYSLAPENSGSALNDPSLIAAPTTVGALRVNWRSGEPVFLEKLRSAYLQDGTIDQLRSMVSGLQPDETLRFSTDTARVDGHSWGRIRRTYVRATEDRAMPTALQDRMIREADALTPRNRFDVHSLPLSHLGLTIDPAPLATLLASLT
ncbi:alpha/beta hydrolase [Amycolatopsis minnesotensis]|uniref:Alpha/beta hydrolase n=1 Tax=Amycolatopsis minnesotensis TaxID=337894 RepID=A0ABN2QFE9_9PSEU